MATPTTRKCLDTIPTDPLLYIFSHFDYRDIVSCCRVCIRFRQLSQHGSLWKQQTRKWWLTSVLPAGESNWQEYFINLYKDYGRYILVYSKIKKAWSQIETYTKHFCPCIYASLQDGATEEELNAAENTVGLQLPIDLRCAYRIHNGQKKDSIFGLMGRIEQQNDSERFLPVDFAAILSTAISGNVGLSQCMPITLCTSSPIGQILALGDEAGNIPGQIFYAVPDASRHFDDDPPMDNFITASSFLQWFTSYAQELENDVYPCLQQQICRFYHDPKCVAETNGIQVKVATAFVPSQSTVNPSHFFHAYHITMKMSKDALETDSCQLETRHWVITDEDGQEETVYGPGVVGEFPVMKPGAEFSWSSCTTFATTYGSMHGYFRMKKLHSDETFNVECPTFHMKCLPYQTSAEREENVLRLKKNV